jgi:DNA helicase-2/ATP-dependent DNA helicase PcrA
MVMHGEQMNDRNNLESFSEERMDTQNALVIANPGTGKTEEIANFAVKLVKDGVDPGRILCVTFTNRAAAEMQQRIGSKLIDEGLKEAAFGINVSTFHAFALDEISGLTGSVRIAPTNFIRASILRTIREKKMFSYGDQYIVGELLGKIENAIRYAKSFNISPSEINDSALNTALSAILMEGNSRSMTDDEIRAFADHFLQIMKSYQEALASANMLDYNDLLSRWLSLPDGKRRLYDWVLVDELQDLNELEFQIALRSANNHFLVGDPKQSIFGFQGGSLKNFKDFTSSLSCEKRYLTDNYRSTDQILAYARRFYEKNGESSFMTEISDLRSHSGMQGGKVKIFFSEEPERAAASLAVDAKDSEVTAIITRRNDQLQEIASQLEASGIKFGTTSPWTLSEPSRLDILRYLKAVISPRKDTFIPAIFTPYSELTVSEAFDISSKYKWTDLSLKEMEKLAPSLYADISERRSKDGILLIMQTKILPIASSLGKDHFFAALSIQNALKEYFEQTDIPDLDELLDYLSISNYEEDVSPGESKLILTTVHKAKGIEFDRVIYVPSNASERTTFIDIVTRAIIMAAKGIDVKQELRYEDSRIDFVAVTRARTDLSILIPQKFSARYVDPDTSETSIISSETTLGEMEKLYSRAYQHFVHGREEDARRTIKHGGEWLRDSIRSYFQSNFTLSYSMISRIESPFNFLKDYIFNIREPSRGMTKGTAIHNYAEMLFRGEDVKDVPDDHKAALENLKSVVAEIEKEFNAKLSASEMSIKLPVGEIFESVDPKYASLLFTGKLDAVFTTDDGKAIIADYKTDAYENDTYTSDHRLQLYIYKLMYSKKFRTDPKKIRIATLYVNLIGRVNTGKVDKKIDRTEPTQRKIDSFIKALNRLLNYKSDPDAFLKDLMQERDLDLNLQHEIKDLISSG